MLAPQQGKFGSLRLLEAARKCGLVDSNLKICLDPADNRSYSGSGQAFNDRTSNAHNFHVGATSGSEASDPTFTGTANTLAAYFNHDGGDYFTLGAANPSWVLDMSEDQAAFTIAMWWYLGDATTPQRLCGTTSTASTGTGFRWGVTSATAMAFVVHNNSTVINPTLTFSNAMPSDAWAFYCISVNESTGASGMFVGCGQPAQIEYVTATSTYTGPAADGTPTTATLQIGASNAQSIVPADTRFGGGLFWTGAKTQAQMTKFFQATRRRYGV